MDWQWFVVGLLVVAAAAYVVLTCWRIWRPGKTGCGGGCGCGHKMSKDKMSSGADGRRIKLQTLDLRKKE